MQVEKLFEGTLNYGTTTKTLICSYGAAGNVTVNVDKTDFLNNILKDFLSDCGVDASYDGSYLFINGVPVTFCFVSTNAYWQACFPFNAVLFGSSSKTYIFSGNLYKFKIFFVGDPNTAFSFMLTTYGGTSYATNYAFNFINARNIFNNERAVLYSSAYNNYIYAIEFNADGTPKNIGRSSSQNYGMLPTNSDVTCTKLKTLASDFASNPNKLPLVRQMMGPFELVDCFSYPENSGLPEASAIGSNQVIVEIDGEEYWLSGNFNYVGMTKCYTEYGGT